MKMFHLSLNQRSHLIFAIVVIFAFAQIIWWTVFQRGYVQDVTQQQYDQWQIQVELANAIVRLNPEARFDMSQAYPQLRWASTEFVISPTLEAEFARKQASHLRMFTYETPFFALVVLLGSWIILLQLRRERQLKKQQQNFLNAVSHEFKTPISTLKLLIQSAQRPQLVHQKKDSYIQKMAQELSRLELTSAQVLAAARLERSQEAPILAEHELNTVVRNILARLQAGLEARGADIHVQYSHQTLPVSLDVDAFTVVLSNILDNAVKYTTSQRKPIHISFSEQKHLIHLHIEDEGIGIRDEEARRIFHRFYRVGNEMTRQSQGVGLGLYLVKHITEAMRGWVSVSSRKQRDQRLQGSRFTITLPRRVTVTYCSKVKAQQQKSKTPLS